VSEGDEIEIKRRGRISRLVVKQLPSKKQVSKDAATSLYEVLEETRVDEDLI
jgi:ribosomal 50S subunit-recycling heat shock protein